MPALLLRKTFAIIAPLTACLACSSPDTRTDGGIDRFTLVNNHNVIVRSVDTLGSLSVGNGEFAFTVDATGLQTFPDHYQNGIPLGTQAQWAWHAFPNPSHYALKDVLREFESCTGQKAPYAVQHKDGRAAEATEWLRANPHRLHLAQVGLVITHPNGQEMTVKEVSKIYQELDLWSGKIDSKFEVDGEPVHVVLFAHQQEDGISVAIESPLIGKKRLGVRIRFPYASDCHVCPGYDWENTDKHRSTIEQTTGTGASILRELDSTRYYTSVTWSDGSFASNGLHEFRLTPGKDSFQFSVVFSKEEQVLQAEFDESNIYNIEHWKNFWMSGGAIDFSECTDPRAAELERRVVLSQYLTKIQCSGSTPPQETGLTMNSWYGKFHLEMYWWHATHFALWNRHALMQRSLEWFNTALEPALATAHMQHENGARWQKMTDPSGNESPSNVGAFIIWQQPHPIYLAEMLYRSSGDQVVLEKYSDMVFESANFMMSFLTEKDGAYHLCHPLIPAQEIFKATETDDPAFELQYWKLGLSIAQTWRMRLGINENPEWAKAIKGLTPLAVANDRYLPVATAPTAYTDDQFRRDHPSVLGALGVLPADPRVDPAIMAATLDDIMKNWQWETTWGWDYPMMAMTAARLNKPEAAIDALMMDVQKNTYLPNGHNYQDRRLRIYLPGNGGLLAAVAMMAAGWDGNTERAPGFPKNGKWDVKYEGFAPIP